MRHLRKNGRFSSGGNRGIQEKELSSSRRSNKLEIGHNLGKRKSKDIEKSLSVSCHPVPLDVLTPVFESPELLPTAKKARYKDGRDERRRHAIAHLFIDTYGSPPRSEWPSIKTAIMARLSIPDGSRNSLQTVFEGVESAAASKNAYDANKGISSRKLGKFLIHEGSSEAELVASCLQRGLGVTQATVLVNELRQLAVPALPKLSWSAVENWSLSTPSIQKHKRETKKSGKEDPECGWSLARLAQCKQHQLQLSLGEVGATAEDIAACAFNPMPLDKIVWWDEKHKKIRLGCDSKHETRTCTSVSRRTIQMVSK